MMAERDTTDRYLAAYLSERVGNEFSGRISGIARFGAFVKMDETGADGLVPVRSLGREFFHFDREAGTLMGSDTGPDHRHRPACHRALDRSDACYRRSGTGTFVDRRSGPADADADHSKRATRRKAVSTKRKKDKIKRKVERKRRQR